MAVVKPVDFSQFNVRIILRKRLIRARQLSWDGMIISEDSSSAALNSVASITLDVAYRQKSRRLSYVAMFGL